VERRLCKLYKVVCCLSQALKGNPHERAGRKATACKGMDERANRERSRGAKP